MIEPLQPRVLWSVTPTTADLPANLTTANNQITPQVAIAADGSFVAVWESDGDYDGDKRGIFARRFAADGTALSGEYVINGTTAGDQTDPTIAMDDAGNFAVAWVSDQGTGRDVYVRLFDGSNAPITGEMLVNAFASSDQVNPAIAMDAAGDFVIAWEGDGSSDGDGVWAQRFSASGSAVGGNFRVNAVTGSKQYNAAISMAADGSFVITHTDDSSGRYIAAQRFSAGGVGQGQIAVDLGGTTSGNSQDISSVASADNGNFIVAWVGSGASSRVAVRQFLADGSAAGAATRVDAAATKEQALPSVAADGAGNFIIVWQDNAIDGNGKGIGGAAFNADLSRNGGVFQVNATAAKDQEAPYVALDNSSRAVAVWGRERLGDNEGISARRFDLGPVLTPNLAPVNSVPGGQSGTEDLSVVFSQLQGNAITVSDPDAAGSFLQVTIAVSGGSLTLAATNGLNFVTGDGAGDSTITFAGSDDAINAALDGLTFSSPSNGSGSYTITITVDDQGNTGVGGAKTDVDTVNITIAAANDAPVNTVPISQTTVEDTSVVFSAQTGNGITIADIDGNAAEVTLAVTSGSLTLSTTAGLTFAAGDGIADGMMVFSGTLAALNTALSGLNYSPAADFAGTATLSVTTNDLGNSGVGGSQSDLDTVLINVTAQNDAPVNQLPPGQSMNGGSLVFSPALGTAVTISDVDAGASPVEVTLSASTGTISLASTTGLTFTSGNGANDSNMTFRGLVSSINAALQGMSYQPPLLFLGTAIINISTNDLGNTGSGGAKSDSDNLSVGVTYPNTAPINSLPGNQTVNEDSNLVLSSTAGNAISIADSTAGNWAVKVTLAAVNGDLSLPNATGLTFVTGDGAGDTTMSFTGTLADVNNALNGLVFQPNANYYGPASISITTNDQGNSGTGGALSDTDTLALTVSPVADVPMIGTTSAVGSYTENDSASPVDYGVILGDADGVLSGATVQITQNYRNDQDVLSFTGTANISASWDAANGVLSLTGNDTVAAYQAALRAVTYANTSDFPYESRREIAFNITDSLSSANAVRLLDVVGVNDAPTITNPLIDQNATEDVPFSFQTPGNTFFDAEADLLNYTASRTDGSALPAWFSFDSATQTFTGTPLNGDNGTFDIRLTVDDAHSGTTSDTFRLTVTAVNDAPTGVLSDLTVAEDAPPTVIDLFTAFDDIDDADSSLTFTVVGNSSPLHLATAVDQTAGTLTLTYAPDTNGSSEITVRATDVDGLWCEAAFDVTVSAVPDAPAITLTPQPLTFVENDIATAIDPLISLFDVDGEPVSAAKVRIVGFVPGQDALQFATIHGIIGVWDNINGVLDLSGGATPAEYQDALRSVLYENLSDSPNTNPRTIRVTIADPDLGTVTGERDLAITALNDAPFISSPSSFEPVADAVAPVVIDPALAVFEPDDDFVDLAEVQIDNAEFDRDVLSAVGRAGINVSYDPGTATLTLQGHATKADYEATLQSVTYANRSQDRDASERVLTVTLTDATGDAGPAVSRRVQVAAFNSPPTTAVPSAQSTVSDQPLTFSNANGNAITIADADSRSGVVQVMLKVRRGSLSLSHTDGLSFTLGDGIADLIMEFTGTLPVVNAALEGLQYIPSAGYSGTSAISVVAKDVGASSSEIITSQRIELEVRPATEKAPSLAIAPTNIPQHHAAMELLLPAPPPPPQQAEMPAAESIDSPQPDDSESGPNNVPPAMRQAQSLEPLIARSDTAERSDLFKPRESPVRSMADAAAMASLGQGDLSHFTPMQSDVSESAIDATLESKSNVSRYGQIAAQHTPMAAALDEMKEEMTDESSMQTIAGTASFVSIGLSVGYFFWAVRAGTLVTSLLSSLPAWKAVDPLSILDEEDEREETDNESLEDIVERRQRKAA